MNLYHHKISANYIWFYIIWVFFVVAWNLALNCDFSVPFKIEAYAGVDYKSIVTPYKQVLLVVR